MSVFVLAVSLLSSKISTESAPFRLTVSQEKQVLDSFGLLSSSVKLDVNQVINATDFKGINRSYVSTDISKRYNWLRYKLTNATKDSIFTFEYGAVDTDTVNFFVVKHGEVIDQDRRGIAISRNIFDPFSINPSYYFDVHLAPGDTAEILIETVQYDGIIRAQNSIYLQSLRSSEKTRLQKKGSILMVFCGFILLAVLLSITLLIFTRKSIYFFYSGFVAVIILNLLCMRNILNVIPWVETYLFLGNNYTEMFGYMQLFFVIHSQIVSLL
ncbi:MAG: 7TM-DISM domain-containing protein [Bacteroidota bacterium]